MPGAIRESVKRVFKSVANDPQYRDWTVEEQHARACEIALETNAATNENLPSLDWAYKFLRPFRNYKRWLDDPWSLGTMARSTWTSQMRSGGESDQHDDSQIDVSPEALPHVMWMWRWALARGRRLTNREVFWASRIYPLLLDEGDQLESSVLYRHATDYAREHRASEVLGEPLDTVPLDLQLVTDNQMAVRPWALSESMEQVVLTLVGGSRRDQPPVARLRDADQIPRWNSLTGRIWVAVQILARRVTVNRLPRRRYRTARMDSAERHAC